MARVELTRAAVEDLGRLVAVLTLPADTRERVRSRLQRLREFPRLGAELSRRWQYLCFVLGPWRWLLLVYEHQPDDDRVVILAVQEAGSSSASTRWVVQRSALTRMTRNTQ